MTNTSWDNRWMNLAELVAGWSKDRSRQVGCAVINEWQQPLAVGWNGFARGVDDDVEDRHERPTKYRWTVHAEENAICNASTLNISLRGCTLYSTLYPCSDCAKAIIQAGITAVICPEPDWDDPVHGFRTSAEMFAEVGMRVKFMEGER